MALQDRLHQPGLTEDIDAIPAHQFSAAMFLWADGTITRANVISEFNITVAEETQLDQLKASYDAKASGLLKLAYILRIEKVLMLFEKGNINLTQMKTMLELT